MELKMVPASDIIRDTKQFQFRTKPFDPHRVEWLVKHWTDGKLDPLDLWLFEGKLYLLSGHHRFEAGERKKVTEYLCRVHSFGLEDARKLAATSNSNRLEYTDFEYCSSICFLMEDNKTTIAKAAEEMTLSVGMAKKYYALRHLRATDWEYQCETLELSSRAYEVGLFCETSPLGRDDLQALFKVVVTNDLSVTHLKQLLRDLKKQKEKVKKMGGGTLFDLADFTAHTVKAVKERAFLDNCAAQAWWLYELIQKEQQHEFPEEMKAEFMTQLKRFHAYCVGSEDENAVPTRANGKGRNLRVNLDSKVS